MSTTQGVESEQSSSSSLGMYVGIAVASVVTVVVLGLVFVLIVYKKSSKFHSYITLKFQGKFQDAEEFELTRDADYSDAQIIKKLGAGNFLLKFL